VKAEGGFKLLARRNPLAEETVEYLVLSLAHWRKVCSFMLD
jgi:hypothetical protein